MKTQYLRYFTNSRIVVVLLLSFSSGLPLALVGSTLQAWYTVSGVSLLTIGALTLVGQPYVYKFFWAPVMDRYTIFKMGRRRGWILLTQFLLVIGLVTMALLRPDVHPWVLAWIAFIVAIFSASQDIAIDAYRADILNPKERGPGAAFTTFGGRLSLLVSGALALIMASHIGWKATYFIMAGLIALNMIITVWAPQPKEDVSPPRTMAKAVVEPMREFMSRDSAVLILIFIIIYKICDALALSLNTAFLIRGIGFSLDVVGSVYKIVALISTLLGSLIAGVLMPRLGLYRSLMYFGLLQALSNLAYMGLAMVGKSFSFMVAAVFAEYFCGGLSSVAFVAFLIGLCDHRYTATQYALFSALSAVGRVFIGPEAALMVNYMGWAKFYFSSVIIGIPALLLLWSLRNRVNFVEEQAV